MDRKKMPASILRVGKGAPSTRRRESPHGLGSGRWCRRKKVGFLGRDLRPSWRRAARLDHGADGDAGQVNAVGGGDGERR